MDLEKELESVAKLARLRLSPEERKRFAGELAEVLHLFDQLDKFKEEIPLEPAGEARLRDDAAKPSQPAPRFEGPKVLE